MMQKSKLFFNIFIASFVMISCQTPCLGQNKFSNIKAYVAVHGISGNILQQYNPNRLIPPASLTKIMTLLMIFDALETQKLRLTDMIKVSRYAASRASCNLSLKPNTYLSVKQIILALITRSANDAAAAIAEHLGQTEANFARHMTERAREFGMLNTTFKNASGLNARGQITTAKDMAILGLITLKHYRQYFHMFATKRFCYNKRCHINHNYRLLSQKKYQFNGIKTGYITASGFNTIATHSDSENPIIIVVLGGKTAALRDKHVLNILKQIKQKKLHQLSATKKLPDNYIDLNSYVTHHVDEKRYSLILGNYGSKLRAETVAKDALGRTSFFKNKNVSTKRIRMGGRYLYRVSVDELSRKEAEQAYAILSYFNIDGEIIEKPL